MNAARYRALLLSTRGQDEACERRLELTLQLLRIQTGLVWGKAERPEEAAVTILYGDDDWLDAAGSGVARSILLSRAGGGPASDAEVRYTRTPSGLRADRDVPGLLWELTQPGSDRQLTGMRARDCHPRLPLDSAWAERLVSALDEHIVESAPADADLVRLRLLGDHPFGLAISHDVDYVVTTLRYRWTRLYYLAHAVRAQPASATRLTSHFGRAVFAPRVWQHDATLAVEADVNVKAEWFVFASVEGNRRGLHARAFNPQYGLRERDGRRLIDGIAGGGHVLGLHASPEAGLDSKLLESERRALEDAAGAEVRSVRHHMGRLAWPEGIAAIRAAGFAYDSSFIVNDAQGYRLGTGWPVPLAVAGGPPVLELAPTWMDTVAFNYNGVGVEGVVDEAVGVIERAERRGGVEGVVWHDIPIRGEAEPGAAYRRILEAALGRGGLVAPCAVFADRARALLAAAYIPDGDGFRLETSISLDELAPARVERSRPAISIGR